MAFVISIIIPTHQRQKFVLEAIESVRRQRFRDWELIVIDDGSDDGTREAVEGVFDLRIRYIWQPHQGVSSARNHGIRIARYDWIAFLDSDDRWQPQKLERQLEGLEASPAYRVCHTDEIWIRKGVRVNPRKHHRKVGGWIYADCLRLCRISPSSILLHRAVLDRVGMFDESLPVCEDYDLWLRICARFPVLYLDEPLTVKSGGHPDQLSCSRWGMDRFRVQALEKTLRSGFLPSRLRELTIRELLFKTRILAQGCEKRGKKEEAAFYRELSEQWK